MTLGEAKKQISTHLGVPVEQPNVPVSTGDTVINKLILKLHLESLTATEIADEVGLSTSAVRAVIRSDWAQALVADYLSYVDSEFSALYGMSVNAVRDALSPKQEIKVRLDAAEKFFRAHGKYNRDNDTGTSAEDVIRRVLEVVRSAKGDTKVRIEEIRR